MTGIGGKKTDTVDARCLATLLRNGTLPETWIPDSLSRDLRNLMCTRLAVREYQTAIKSRIIAELILHLNLASVVFITATAGQNQPDLGRAN
jgi:transposase